MLRKKRHCVFIFLVFICLTMTGCSAWLDIPRTIWGSSTRALEKARREAVTHSYHCSVQECFEAILAIAHRPHPPFHIFLKNRKKQHIVVMGIEGNIDTTEVGIFLNAIDTQSTHVDIASLSSSAKRKVAEILMNEFQKKHIKIID